MNSVWVVSGLGPNDIEVPALIFETEASAKSYIFDKLGREFDDKNQMYFSDVDSEDEIEDLMTGVIFKSAYFGCGCCDVLELKEVKFGEVFVKWDLD